MPILTSAGLGSLVLFCRGPIAVFEVLGPASTNTEGELRLAQGACGAVKESNQRLNILAIKMGGISMKSDETEVHSPLFVSFGGSRQRGGVVLVGEKFPARRLLDLTRRNNLTPHIGGSANVRRHACSRD